MLLVLPVPSFRRVDDKSRGFNMSNLARSTDSSSTRSASFARGRSGHHVLSQLMEDTRLDLRMNPESGPSAAEWLQVQL